jgi:tRNA pseudouridine38-40 synthase
MVRNLAGVLMSIGKKEHTPSWARQVLEVRDRACGGITAPPQGLYFIKVEYDPRYSIEI